MKDFDWDRLLGWTFGLALWGGFFFMLVAIPLKLFSVVAWRWWLILLPLEIGGGLFLLLALVIGIVTIFNPPIPFR